MFAPSNRTFFCYVLTSHSGEAAYLDLFCLETDTDPEGVGGLEGVLWFLWRCLRLRRRRELAGLDQGLRIWPDIVVLCLHLGSLPPLDDLGRKERVERAEE